MWSASAWLALAALAIAGALGFAGGFALHVRLDQAPGGLASQLAACRSNALAAAQAAAQAASRAKEVAEAQAAVTAASEREAAKAQARIVTVTRTVTKEIPVALPPSTDRRYPLPVGFVRLHDAFARGIDLSAVADPAGRADDAASGVAASHAIAVIGANYGACRADQARLAGLQRWLSAERAAAAPP